MVRILLYYRTYPMQYAMLFMDHVILELVWVFTRVVPAMCEGIGNCITRASFFGKL